MDFIFSVVDYTGKEFIMPKKKIDYYDNSKIMSEGSTYNVIIGQRSNGKTYAFIEDALDTFLKEDIPSAYIRRYDESLTSTNIFKLCTCHIPSLIIMSNGKWNNFKYEAKTFYLTYVDGNGKQLRKSKPFLYCVGLNSWEHKKGQDRGDIKFIIFDEFLTRDTYLNDEYAKFMNLVSSLIRDRSDTVIIMLGNTVNKFCPYFNKFKINIREVKQGMIYNFRYGETTLSLEYCREYENTSKVNKKYFDFPEKSLDMIKKGYWEISTYPHLYNGKKEECKLVGMIYVHFGDLVLRWELLIDEGNNVISFISPSNFDKALCSKCIFITKDSLTLLDSRWCFSEIPHNKLTDWLIKTWRMGKIYFSTDDSGDVFENFMKNCVTSASFRKF